MHNPLGNTATILPPTGVGKLFVALNGSIVKNDPSKRKFKVYSNDAIRYLCGEFIAQGCFRIVTFPGSDLSFGNKKPAHPLRNLFHIIDKDLKVKQRTRILLQCMFEELVLPIDAIDAMEEPFIGPERAIMMAANREHSRHLADLIAIACFTYQLLLGIEHRLQISIPLNAFRAALARIRAVVRSENASMSLSFLSGLMQTYSPYTVGSFEIAMSTASDTQIEIFQSFLDDEDFEEYSEWRHLLGFPHKIKMAIRKAHVLCKRILRKRKTKTLIDYGVRVIAANSGVSVPDDKLSEVIGISDFMPPIVDMSGAIRRAQKSWLAHHPKYTQLITHSPSAPDLSSWLIGKRGQGMMSVGRRWLIGMYKEPDLSTFAPDDAQQILLNHCAKRLSIPTTCKIHMMDIAFSDWRIEWEPEKINFHVSACCEDHIKETWVYMLAVD